MSVGYITMLASVIGTGGKPYYLAGSFRAHHRPRRRPLVRFLLIGRVRLVIPTVIFALPIAFVGSPVLGRRRHEPRPAESVGWDNLLVAGGHVELVREQAHQAGDGLEAARHDHDYAGEHGEHGEAAGQATLLRWLSDLWLSGAWLVIC